MFTGAIKLANIDDYITPSQQCVKPLMVPSTPIVQPGILKADTNGKATVTLTDCLACSGCVTSAETILIQQMSIKQFKIKAKQTSTVLLISPQSRVALSNYFKIPQQQVLPRMKLFLKKQFKVTEVFQIVQGINMAHKLTAEQLENQMGSQNPHLPILVSECPGWVCYAEKTTSDEVVSHMSTIKSPQQILASIIRRNREEEQLFIVAVMPCYDKKLEAIRFVDQKGEKEVDLVLTSTEMIDLIRNPVGGKSCSCEKESCQCCYKQVVKEQYGKAVVQNQSNEETKEQTKCKQSNTELSNQKQFTTLPLSPSNYSDHYLQCTQFPSTPKQLTSVTDPKSNGYLYHMIKHFNASQVTTKTIRNSDFIQYTMKISGTQVKMAQCFGFRNIQTIVRQIKNKKCGYIYVEVMACPMGCVNGGGQPKEEGVKPRELAESLENQLRKVVVEENKVEVGGGEERYKVQYKALEKHSLNDW